MVSRVLPLEDRMFQHNKHAYRCCSLCFDSKIEDEKHLFLECKYSKYVWFALSFMNITSLNQNYDIKDWLQNYMNDSILKKDIDKNSFHSLVHMEP